MTQTVPLSFFPKKMQVLSGSALKLLAIIVMLIDHIGANILTKIPAAMTNSMSIGSYSFSLYRLSRDVGRIAFPIFCFLIVEGCLHTRNRVRYGINLFLFALISELPWNYVHSGNLTYEKQNVYFTLFLGYLGMCALDYFREEQGKALLCLLVLFFIASRLNADYGWKGYIFLLIMYTLREQKTAQAVVGSAWLYWEWKACFAFLPINLYNGKRGFIHGPVGKYVFYAFYPVHLLILGYIRFHVL